MYGVFVLIILFFIVLSVMCAGDNDFDIPYRWTRSLDTDVYNQTLRTSCVPGLKYAAIRRTNDVEIVYFERSLRDVRLAVSMNSKSSDLERGNFFEVCFSCLRCGHANSGFVTSFPLNSKSRRFMVVGPNEEPDTNFVKYQNNRTHALNDFCEYRAEETLFTVTRFLCEYEDLSYFFVSAQVTYACMHNVVIEWGIREHDGALRANQEETRQEFNFPLCACAPMRTLM